MNILVTGVSKGVGLEICKSLIQKGHTVYGISRTYTKELEELKRQYEDRFFHKIFDLSNVSDIHVKIFKAFIPNKIQLGGFVNNAAMAYDDIITNMNYSKLEAMYKTNVFAPMIMTKYVIRNMMLSKKGAIVHISSISAHTGYKGLAMYASTKGALEAFSKNTAREWGELGVRSNVVIPGFMETAMSESLSEDQKRRIYQRTSLKRDTDITSVAETVCFLLSNEACSITGQNIHVDNGTI
ncbi:MAG: SDR family oxidoreductase [Bacteroidales bacterium]